MISLEDARTYVLSGCPPQAPVRWPLADSLGCVLAEPIVAGEAIPPFANTAMDGFALRAADTAGATAEAPVTLRIAGTLAAGHTTDRSLEPGEALRIMTGAPMPPGADAVVMVELTRVSEDRAAATEVEVLAAVEPGNHVRPAGDDITIGQEVFDPGVVLSPGHLGVLASLGHRDILVFPRVRVGVFSTGDELVDGSEPLRPGQIRDSNRITLLALLAQSGCEGVDLGRIADDETAITEALATGAAQCDALITSGGVSMGDFDFVKVVLDRVGDMAWMQVSIRPAKPLAFGTVPTAALAGPDEGDGGSDAIGDTRRVPVFGLPGNPVSSMVSFELFARPALRQMMGHAPDALDRPHVLAVTDDPIRRRPDGKIHFARVVCHYDEAAAGYRVRVAGGQGSHQLSAMATADGLAILPDGDGVAAGGVVRTMLLA